MTDLELAAYVRASGDFGLTAGESATVADRIEALVNDVRVLKADLDRSEDNVSRLIAERDEAQALLREARVFVKHLWNDSEAQKLLARIDALLAKTEGTT